MDKYIRSARLLLPPDDAKAGLDDDHVRKMKPIEVCMDGKGEGEWAQMSLFLPVTSSKLSPTPPLPLWTLKRMRVSDGVVSVSMISIDESRGMGTTPLKL